MIVLDTHAWIWWVSEPARLGRRGARMLQKSTSIGVCAISLWELSMLVQKKRLSLDRNLLTWIRESLALPRVKLLPLTPAVAALGSGLEIHGDPGDRIIVATALLEGATLVTKDAALQDYGPLKTIW